jgi:hypothetical protein
MTRVTRWLLLLQEFDITILDKPGKDNVVADFLYRLTSNENEPSIEDFFPDEHLFVISTNTLWFVNIANYLDMQVGYHNIYLQKNEKISLNRVGDSLGSMTVSFTQVWT